MKTQIKLLGLTAVAALAHTSVFAQTYNQNFEDLPAGAAPDLLATGFRAETGGNVPNVTSLITNDPALVIAGNNSLLLTVPLFPSSTSDFDIGGYYSGSNGGSYTNIAPGTYQLTASIRLLDSGITSNLLFYYQAFNTNFATQTTDTGNLASPTFTSLDSVFTWTSPSFTINPDNQNFYTGLQVQAVAGNAEVTNARWVLDSVSLAVVPEPSLTALSALAALGLMARRRR